MKTIALWLLLQSVCPLGEIMTPESGFCVVPIFIFGIDGPHLWGENRYDYSLDGITNIVDIQLIVNQLLAGGDTYAGPASIEDVQNTINAALQPHPVTPPGTAGLQGDFLWQ